MLSDLQKRKLTLYFNLYDVDGSGSLERADFDQGVDEFCDRLGLRPGSPDHTFVKQHELEVWEFIRKAADRNDDEQVSLDEFLASFEALLGQRELFSRLLKGYADYLLTALDQDGDGRISEDEFVANVLVLVDEPAAREAFRRQDLDGSGYLSKAELLDNLEAFFYSDDPDAPGNWAFGPY